MDFFDLFDYGFAWVFVIFAFLYGLSGVIQQWDSFGAKLVNCLLLVGAVVLFFLMWDSNDFIEAFGVFACGAAALWLGNSLSDSVGDQWNGIAGIFGIIAFIAMFIMYGAYAL